MSGIVKRVEDIEVLIEARPSWIVNNEFMIPPEIDGDEILDVIETEWIKFQCNGCLAFFTAEEMEDEFKKQIQIKTNKSDPFSGV